MAQLFNIYFPKYHFLLQREFTIQFNGKVPLPFKHWISSKGKCYVEELYYDDNQYTQKELNHWKSKGLQTGLTIIKINNEKIDIRGDSDIDTDDLDEIDEEYSMSYSQNDDKNDLNESVTKGMDHTKSNLDEILETFMNNAESHEFITITFREELSSQDDSKPLGLSYKSPSSQINLNIDPIIHDHKEQEEEESYDEGEDEFEMIPDRKITASSCQRGYEHTHCRLNDSNSFWKPSMENEQLGDVWICFDLGMVQSVTRLYIQGDLKHRDYVTQLYIDYSNDGCQWKSHPMKIIKCKYVNGDSIINLCDYKTAEIEIFPTIHAQFIRVRPYDWHNSIAMRCELYGMGPSQPHYNECCRTVTLDTVNENEKSKLLKLTRDKSRNTKVVQLDCKAIITKALERARISSYATVNADKDHYICTFTTPNSLVTERAMDSLAESGVGREIGVVSATSIAYRNASADTANDDALTSKTPTKKGKEKKPYSNAGFYKSIKRRMVVKQVVERIMAGAALTFDYCMMLLVASLIAVAGLATDSSVIVVASMLVSPIMGPVLALSFGWTLKDWNMFKMGIKNELFSLLVCVTCGFVTGYIWFAVSAPEDDDGNLLWPTKEMQSRGHVPGLASGAFIAAVSGVGVALSVLGEYLSTVIGVAISASLLPPAVNCGMLIALTLYGRIGPRDMNIDSDDTLHQAGISFALTIINIIIIIIVARFMFWIKNVYMRQDQNEQIWGSISSFKQKYTQYVNDKAHDSKRKLPKIKRNGVSFIDNKNILDPDDPLNDIEMVVHKPGLKKPKSDGSAIVDNMDIYAEPGTDVSKCIGTVKHVLSIDDMNASTLKGILMRQASHLEMAEGRKQQRRDKPKVYDIFPQQGHHLQRDDGSDDDYDENADPEDIKYRIKV